MLIIERSRSYQKCNIILMATGRQTLCGLYCANVCIRLCDRKLHTDGRNRKLDETFGSSPCDQKSHTDGESEMWRSALPHVIRSPILKVKVKMRRSATDLRLQTWESRLTGNEWHLIAHGIRNALTIRTLNDVSNNQLWNFPRLLSATDGSHSGRCIKK